MRWLIEILWITIPIVTMIIAIIFGNDIANFVANLFPNKEAMLNTFGIIAFIFVFIMAIVFVHIEGNSDNRMY